MTVDDAGVTTAERARAAPEQSAPAPSDAGLSTLLSRETVAVLSLMIILLLGATFRFTGLNWDGNHHLHPDERFLTGVASRLETVSNPLNYLRTSESTLNPYNQDNVPLYVYGNFPMTVTRIVAEWVDGVCQNFESLCAYNFTAYDGIHLLGRFLSGFVDLFSVFFIFLIGRRLYDWRAGLLGALLLSLSVMPIQQSHFFTMDNWAATLSTVTVYAAVRAAESGQQKRWWALFGLLLGLTVASRINMAPLAAMAGVAAVVWLARRQRREAPGSGWRYLNTEPGSVDLQRAILGVLLAAVVSLVTFRLAQPYAFADPAIARESFLNETGRQPSSLRVALQSIVGFNPQWLANLSEIQNLQSPEATFPPALQWTDRAPLLFPLTNMVLYGMGLVAGVVAVIGFLWALWRAVRLRLEWTAHALPVTWAGGYFLFMGTRWVKSVRYFLPVYPFLLLLAGWALVELWRRAGRRSSRRVLVAGLVALTVVPTFLWANAFVDVYREPMTRIAASRWMFENVPTGATLVYDVQGEERELQLPLKSHQFRSDGLPLDLSFTLPDGGTVRGLRFNYLTLTQGGSASLNVSLATAAGTVLQDGETTFSLSDERQPVYVDLQPETLEAGRPYVLGARHAGGSPVEAGTSRIANEEWDDLLPVSVDNKPAYAAYYSEVTGGQRPVTWPASEEKRRLMLQWIEEADVIALSSQRALWSTPRLPLTHPLNVAYYRSLFNGDLGFELAAQFHADLNVGPLTVSDTGGEVAWGHPPQIGWPPPGELAAEEAFSVYDHPPVWIFRKTDDYSAQAAREILQAVDLNSVVNMNPGEATQAPNGLLLQPWQWRAQQVSGTFDEIFNVDGLLSQRPAAGAAVWWLSIVVLGWLAFPVAFSALPGLPDRGYALSRVLALLFVSWLAWMAASYDVLPHTRRTLLLSVAVLALLSLIVVIRRRQALLTFLRDNLAYVGFVELLALALFLLAIGIRLGNPDVWDVIWGGEKPMDLSYFTAVLKSTSFPPYDPWYAGGYINYYYYGFVYAGALTKLLGIVPTVAYNLILPTLFSFTGLGAFAVAYNLVRHLDENGEQRLKIGEQRLEISARPVTTQSPISNYQSPIPNLQSLVSSLRTRAITAGLAAALLCVILGNLGQVGVLVNAWQQAGDPGPYTGVGLVDTAIRTVDGALAVTVGGQDAPLYPGDWFWTATRAININEGEAAPITEFPFFTFLYGDLHAHMIALPLTLLALAWAVSLVLRPPPHDSPRGPDRLQTALVWLTGALAIGVLRATNTWDWPTYLLLGLLAVLYHAYVSNGRRLGPAMLGQAAFQGTALAVLSTLLFWPYVDNYGSGYQSLRLWDGSYTHLTNYLVIYGLFLFLIFTHLAREFRAWSRTWTTQDLAALEPYARPLLLGLFLYVILVGALFTLNYWIAPVVLTLAAFAGLLGLRPGLPPARRVLLILVSAGLALTLMVEVVVLEGDIGRMNTVFKFYLQVWVLFSVAGGAALALAWPTVRRRLGHTQRRLWQGLLLLLVGAAALYPLLATPARWNIRMSDEAPTTLDGMAFMRTTSYGDTAYDGSSRTIELDDEYEALRWMQRNVEGTPVVAEAHTGNPYRAIANRVAMYTGLPAIVGWDWHQRQQRAAVPDSLVWERVDDVRRFFETTNVNEALAIIEEYNVQYVYAGELERAYYPPQGLEKFREMADAGLLREVFRNEGVTIYEVVNAAQEISELEQENRDWRVEIGDLRLAIESLIPNLQSPITNRQLPISGVLE